MSNFNELIKQKIEQFDVPYNKSHWAEMEEKLNAIHTAKIRRNTLTTIAAITIVGISSFLYLNSNTTTKNQIVDTTLSTKTNKNNTLTPKLNSTNNSVTTSDKNMTSNAVNNNTNAIIAENTVNVAEINSEKNTTETSNTTPTTIKKNQNNPILPTNINAKFIVFNNSVCIGEEVSFEANEKNATALYFWDFGDGNTANQQNPNHIYAESGKFDVTLTIVNKKTETTHTERNAAVILPQPKANFSYTETSLKHDNNKLKYPYTKFSSKDISNTNSYSWNFGNGETSTAQNPKIIFNNKASLQVMLTVKNTYGCYNSTIKTVEIKNAFDLFAPNSFTPDNDGKNDDFIPKALLGWDVQFEMVITDLANSIVYKTADKHEPWEGRLNNNGSILPPGIYLWKVVTYDAEGKNHQHVGRVNLLR